MSVEVVRAGLLTSVQDRGRYGLQKHGVIVGGAMDRFALRAANLLVGNAEGEAALECTLIGPVLRMQEDVLVAVCGGDFSPKVNGQEMPQWQPVLVKAGSTIEFGRAKAGCRAYLAVAGGWQVPEVMGSKSTYLRAGIGGYEGRALKNGDVLAAAADGVSEFARRWTQQLQAEAGEAHFVATKWSVSPNLFPEYAENPTVSVLCGHEFERFDAESRARFFDSEFTVTPQSDRMGYRLAGPILQLESPFEMVSEAVAAGTIQVPSDGNPILLLADRQTTGGYPRIGQVATVDLPVMAQVKPGGKVRFAEVTLAEAQRLLLAREREMDIFKQGLRLL